MNGKRNILFVDKDAYPSLEEPELFDTLAAGAGSIRVERIVSNGQVTPEGEWYDQDLDEWVVVLEGEARLHYMDGEEVGLKKGDSLFLPKRRKHRVVYTSSPCIWLAIHADLLTPQSVVADAIWFSPRRRGNSSYGRIPFFAPCIGHEKRVCREANP